MGINEQDIDVSISHITPAGTSVLEDLGASPEFQEKSKLVIRIRKTIDAMGLNQTQAAREMGIKQPEYSNMLRGKLHVFSRERLETCLQRLGHDITVTVSPRHDGPGIRRIEVQSEAA